MKRNCGTYPVKVIMVDQRGLFDKWQRAATESGKFHRTDMNCRLILSCAPGTFTNNTIHHCWCVYYTVEIDAFRKLLRGNRDLHYIHFAF
jgi:hypothetical protein